MELFLTKNNKNAFNKFFINLKDIIIRGKESVVIEYAGQVMKKDDID